MKNLGLYNTHYGDIPLAKEHDQHIHAILLGFQSAKFDATRGEYFFENTANKNEKVEFSPNFTSTSKRSRSAPDKEEKENYEIRRPRRFAGHGRLRRNSAWEPHQERSSAASSKRSRSTPEIEDVQNKQKRIHKNQSGRQSRYGKYHDEGSERGTPTSSRSKSDHRPMQTVRKLSEIF